MQKSEAMSWGFWGLPVSIVEAVAWHHYPYKSVLQTFGALTAVHVANTLQRDRNSKTSKFPHPRFEMITSLRLASLGD